MQNKQYKLCLCVLELSWLARDDETTERIFEKKNTWGVLRYILFPDFLERRGSNSTPLGAALQVLTGMLVWLSHGGAKRRPKAVRRQSINAGASSRSLSPQMVVAVSVASGRKRSWRQKKKSCCSPKQVVMRQLLTGCSSQGCAL